VGNGCLMGMGFPIGFMKMFWNLWWRMDSILNILKTTESFALKLLFLCYINFTSIKNNSTNLV
jgi:hypothetical protein